MIQTKFVTSTVYAESLGITMGVIKGWMKRHWTKGNEYIVIGKVSLINLERAEAWVAEYGALLAEKDEMKKTLKLRTRDGY